VYLLVCYLNKLRKDAKTIT